uniref:6-methylsalicylate decarboxylase n=1 Tax=Ovatospora brasiliensis TaxID=1934393 RepID=A0A8K0ZEV8_9PEZI|nr:Decarboxylase [Ovatospora brasiliensis]
MGYIDVHHHFLTEDYAAAWKASGDIPPGLTPPQWSIDLDLAFLDRHNIDTAILSLSAPGVGLSHLTPEQAVVLARQINEQAAAIRDAHPSRFGFFATLPILNSDDISLAVEEARYALDTLHADGVTLFTSYHGRYLGHADFTPLWEELNRRAAVVFVHPASLSPSLPPPAKPRGSAPTPSPASSSGTARPSGPPPLPTGVPPPIIDFPHETTRTAVHLITSNALRRFPHVKIILSHGGGTLPYVATRVAHLTADTGILARNGDTRTAQELLEDAKKFYFDVALSGFEEPLGLLTRFAKEEHVLWGSDFPFVREATVGGQMQVLEGFVGKGEGKDGKGGVVGGIQRHAAERLFPRLARRGE